MRTSRTFLLAAGLFALAACRDDVPQPLSPDRGDTPRTDVVSAGDGSVRVLVALNNRRPLEAVEADIRDIGGTIVRTYANIGGFAVEITEPEQRRAIAALDGVLGVSDDGESDIQLDESLAVIRADQVQDLGWTGAGRTIAILDNGFDANHPFLAGRVVRDACFSTSSGKYTSLCRNGVSADVLPGASSLNRSTCLVAPFLDPTMNELNRNICTHGQHVAGIAAGSGTGADGTPKAGVAPDARLIVVQVFSRKDTDCGTRPAPCTSALDADIIAGLDYVAGLLTAPDIPPIVAVNLSLGGTLFSTSCNLHNFATTLSMMFLRAKGVMPVVSSGNDSKGDKISYPACISAAVAVGNTQNNDAILVTSNRGPLLDLFAPGTSILSSVDLNGFGRMTGTSMAAPHVAGAFAVLKQAYPAEDVGQLLTRMQSTGKILTYHTADQTPRLDLKAALCTPSCPGGPGDSEPPPPAPEPPVLTVNAANVTVPEGSLATNGGVLVNGSAGPATLTASRGTVAQNGTQWTWSEPTVDNGAYPVTITATGPSGPSAAAAFTVTVTNVAPTLTLDPEQVTTGPELTTIPISATFTDPGVLDFTAPAVGDPALGATITCYSGAGTSPQPVTVSTTVEGGILQGTITSPGCPYGDNGTFTASVTVTDKDGASDTKQFTVTITNVAPTVSFLAPATTLINGQAVVLTQAGVPTDFTGRATDPGSDDLTLTWDWQDGTPPRTVTSLSAPPAADPPVSPSVSPRVGDRAFTDLVAKTFATACLREVTLTAEDDDGGRSTGTLAVIITGTAGRARSSGYWQTQYRNVRSSPVGQDALTCYLAITNALSVVYSEVREANTLAQAGAILQNAGGGGDTRRILDQQLLAVWINFANGAWQWDTLVDADGDGTPETTLGAALLAAEAVRANPTATGAQLDAQKAIMERLNLSHGG